MESLTIRKSLQPNDIYEQTLVLWAREVLQFFNKLSFNVAREVSNYLRDCSFLVSITDKTLRVHRLPSTIASVHSLAKAFNRSIVLLLNETEVICIGSFPGSDLLSTIDLLSLQIAELPPMTANRYRPGAIKFEKFVYIFGGFRRGTQFHLNSSEKFSVFHQSCQSLPQMRTNRAAFSPVCFQRSIFLPDFLLSEKLLDVFQPDSDSYSVVQIEVPRLEFGGVYAVNGDCLLSFRYNHLLSMKISTESWDARRFCVCMDSSGSLSEVKRLRKKLFWVNCRGELLRFDLERGDFETGGQSEGRQIKKFEYEHDFLEHMLPPYT